MLHRSLAVLAVLAVLATAIGTVASQAAEAQPPARSAAGTPSVLAPGQTIRSGSSLASPDGFVTLRMQRDGNLIVVAGGHVLWSTRTHGAGSYAQLSRTGILAVYNPGRRQLWSSRTSGSSTSLRVGDDGNVTLRASDGHTLFSTNTRAVELDQGNYLYSGQFLINQRGDRLTQQSDGNLVLRRSDGTVRWSAGSQNHAGAFTLLQRDGNLVTYSAGHRVLWNSGAAGPGARLSIGPDGTLSLRRSNGSLRWTSNPPAASTPRPQTAAAYASAILKMWGGKVTGLPGAYSDLLATSRNQTITNSDSCGRTVRVDTRLVQFLYDVTSHYKIKINNIITGHGCDSADHPKGMATDLGGAWSLATGGSTSFGGFWGPNNPSLDAQFVTYISTILPVGSGLGQQGCPGVSSARLKAGIAFFADSCNHQHVQV